MGVAILPLRKVQVGKESTPGTRVAATKQLIGNVTVNEEQAFYRSQYPQGYRANVGGAGIIVSKGLTFTRETELTPEEIIWALHCGIQGSVTPTVANTTENTWVFTPQLTTAIPTLEAATFEFVDTDGTTNHNIQESGYCMCSGFDIDWAPGQPVKLTERWFGRSRQTDTPTAALSPITGREVLAASMGVISLDTSWAGLGGTALSAIVKSGKISVETGIIPDMLVDGRLDFSSHRASQDVKATVDLVLEMDSVGAGLLANYRANDVIFVRQAFTGSTISVNPKKVMIDGAFRFTGDPSRGDSEGNVTIAVKAESVLDATSSKTLLFTVVNAVAAL